MQIGVVHDKIPGRLRLRSPELYRAEDRPLMNTTHELDRKRLIAVKGRPEEMLARCTHQQLNGELEPLSEADRQSVVEANAETAGRALRVLAVAYKRVENGDNTGAEDLVWLGLAGC